MVPMELALKGDAVWQAVGVLYTYAYVLDINIQLLISARFLFFVSNHVSNVSTNNVAKT